MRQEHQELKIILDSVLSLSPSLGCLRPVSLPSRKERWSVILANKHDTVKTPIPVSLGNGSRDKRVWLLGPSESHLELALPVYSAETLPSSLWPEQIKGSVLNPPTEDLPSTPAR